jgi:hypothetical protein
MKSSRAFGFARTLPVIGAALVMLLQAACVRGSLRNPLCDPGDFVIPAGVEGTYTFGFQGNSPLMKNIPQTTDTEIAIKRNPKGDLEIWMTLTAETMGTLESLKNMVPVTTFGICQKGNRYFLEFDPGSSSDQGFGPNEMFIFDSGISLSPLVFDFSQARDMGFAMYIAPEFRLSSKIDSVEESRFETVAILDNPPGSTNTILRLAKSGSFMTFLRRAPEAKALSQTKPLRLVGRVKARPFF